MNDCANADLRDRLPDLLNGTLSQSEASAVQLHIDSCLDCRQELELLRGIRRLLLTTAPAVDASRIVSVLPVAQRPQGRSWASWRVAAAITVVALGGSTFALLHRGSTQTVAPDSVASAPMETASLSDTGPLPLLVGETADASVTPVASSPSTTASGSQMTVTTTVGDLTDSQLEGLMDRISHVEAVPLADPVPRAVPAVLSDKVEVKDLGGLK